ncbi:hypothetical protein [Burkholderia contaminans]|nr:hypothetical protein [Burkholderia contaminans]
MTPNGEGTTLASAPVAPDRRPPDTAQLERLLLRARKAHHEGALLHAEHA